MKNPDTIPHHTNMLMGSVLGTWITKVIINMLVTVYRLTECGHFMNRKEMWRNYVQELVYKLVKLQEFHNSYSQTTRKGALGTRKSGCLREVSAYGKSKM